MCFLMSCLLKVEDIKTAVDLKFLGVIFCIQPTRFSENNLFHTRHR
jgi:hypothetical protein